MSEPSQDAFPSPKFVAAWLTREGVSAEMVGSELTVTLEGGEAGDALSLLLELTGGRARLSADFAVDARDPQTLLELLWLANDLNAALSVGRAFVEPEYHGDELAGATLWVTASLPLREEAHLAVLPAFVRDFGADVRAALSALLGGE